MAFLSDMTAPDGRTYTAAYVKVTPTATNATHGCSMLLEVWDTQASKVAGYECAFTSAANLPFAVDLANSNPVDYSYKLLQASDAYPNATWNI